MSAEVKEYLDKLTDLWGEGENVKFAYEVAMLYNSGDFNLIYRVIEEFEDYVGTLNMCNGCN